MRIRTGILLTFCLSFLIRLSTAEEKVKYKVIVNTKNQIGSLSKKQLSNYFLKKRIKWADGTDIHPVDLSPDSEIREFFSQMVHKRSIPKIKAYWQKQIFSGEKVPPPQLLYENDVLGFVESDPCAIGYVAGDQPIQKHKVKVIAIVE